MNKTFEIASEWICKIESPAAWHATSLGIVYHLKQNIIPRVHPMKKFLKNSQRLTLGDLVLAVSSVSRNSSEAAAAVTDLLESGRVRLTSNGRTVRARVA
jgi:hypothetical protein